MNFARANVIVPFLALLAVHPLLGQVSAREISEQEAKAASAKGAPAQGMKSPMLLELPLKTKSGLSVLNFLRTMSEVWRTDETAGYVVDEARVTGVEIRRLKAKKGRTRIGVEVGLSTTWFRQDLDLTLAVVAGDREIGKRVWDNLTIGNDAGAVLVFGSSSKERALEIDLSDAEWASIDAGPMPTLRIIVDIQEDGEE